MCGKSYWSKRHYWAVRRGLANSRDVTSARVHKFTMVVFLLEIGVQIALGIMRPVTAVGALCVASHEGMKMLYLYFAPLAFKVTTLVTLPIQVDAMADKLVVMISGVCNVLHHLWLLCFPVHVLVVCPTLRIPVRA